MDVNVNNVAAVVFSGVGISVFGYMLYNFTLSRLGSKKASIFMHFIPFFTVLLTIFLENKYPLMYQVIGLLAILIGVATVLCREGKNEKI